MPAGSAALGIGQTLGNVFSDSSQNTTYSGNQNTTQSGTSTTTKNLTPYQAALQSPLANLIGNVMSNPTSYLAPYQTAAINANNSNYSGLADTLRQQFLQSGGGSNGKFGTALAQGDISRLSGNANIQNSFAQQAASLPLQASNLALNFLGQNYGQTTASNATSASSMSGSQNTSSMGFKI